MERGIRVIGTDVRRGGGRIFFSRVDFLCRLLFRYPFHLRVTAVARKRSLSFFQKVQVAGYSQTRMHLTYVALHEVTWRMVVWCTQNFCQDGSSFKWHQPCQRCKYTTSVDIQKASHSCRITSERSKRRIALYKSDQQQHAELMGTAEERASAI